MSASARGQRFPALVTKLTQGYSLEITVHPGPQHVRVSPPQALAPGDVWPNSCFQVLLVASEYCAAVQELIAWAFPIEWDDYKLMVADFAAAFISTSKPVPLPGRAAPEQPGNHAIARVLCHSIWANFTFLYFNGTRDLNMDGLAGETKDAGAWLLRLVGKHGWASEGPAFGAARTWVTSMQSRLVPMFPGVDFGPEPAGGTEAAGADAAAAAAHSRAWQWQAGSERELVEKSERGGNSSSYFPIYPYRITSGFSGNRIKFTLQKQSAVRSICNCCGVPDGFGQSRNHAIGYLLLSDVLQAFYQASKAWQASNPNEVKDTILGFFDNVVESDTAPLAGSPGIERYASCLVGCTLGWSVAVEQVRCWVAAAVDMAQAAAGGAHPPQLVLPRTVTPETMAHFASLTQYNMDKAQAEAAQETAAQAAQAAAQALLVPGAPAALHQPFFQPAAPGPQQRPLGLLGGLQLGVLPGSNLDGLIAMGAGANGTGLSPFAIQQRASTSSTPLAHGSPQPGHPPPPLQQHPPQQEYPPSHQQRSPESPEDVAGGISNMSLDGVPVLGDETLALLTDDLGSLREVADGAVGAGVAGPATAVPGPLGGVGQQGGLPPPGPGPGPFGALAAGTSMFSTGQLILGMMAPLGRTVTTAAPAPQQQHLQPYTVAARAATAAGVPPPAAVPPHGGAAAMPVPAAHQHQPAVVVDLSTAVSRVVELLSTANGILGQLTGVAAAHPAAYERLTALVRGQEEALLAFCEEHRSAAAAAAGSAAGGFGHGINGAAWQAQGAGAGLAAGPAPPQASRPVFSSSGPTRTSASPFGCGLVPVPSALQGCGNFMPMPNPGGGAGGSGRGSGSGPGSLPGLVPGAFGAAAAGAEAGPGARPGPSGVGLSSGAATATPSGGGGAFMVKAEDHAEGGATGPIRAVGAAAPAGSHHSGGGAGAGGSDGNGSGSGNTESAWAWRSMVPGAEELVMLGLVGGGNASAMSIGGESLLELGGLDGGGNTLGLGAPMGSEGLLIAAGPIVGGIGATGGLAAGGGVGGGDEGA